MVKQQRLEEVIELQQIHSLEVMKEQIGKEEIILVEKVSRRSEKQMVGRTDRNHKVVFDRGEAKIGDYLTVRITNCTSATLFGELIKN